MKKFKSQYQPDSTVFDRTTSVCFFETFLVRYGKILDNGKYKLELLLPIMKAVVIPVYLSKRKPMFHNIYIIGILWFVFYVLSAILISATIGIVFILQIFFGFFYSYLLDDDDVVLRISGFISLALSIIGIVTVIKWFI